VATAGFGQKETRRRKLITGLVVGALAVTVLTVSLAYWLGLARKDQPLPVPQNLPTNVHQQVSGYTFTRSDEGRRLFTVHAARTVAFKQGGTTVLEDVFVEVFGRAGNRRDVMRTRRCDYNTQSGDLFSSGTVQIELNAQADVLPGAGLRGKHRVSVETSKVAFQKQGSLVVSEEPVRFRIGPASGTAHGMTYATKEGWLELKKDVAMELRPGGGTPAQLPVQLSAGRLRYDKANGEVTLWGPLEVSQGSRRVVAERGIIFLDEQNQVTRASLEGNVGVFDSSEGRAVELGAQRVRGDFEPVSGELRYLVAEDEVVGKSKGKGSVSHLAAQHLELSFAGSHPKPRSGSISGNVQLTVESLPALDAGIAAATRPPLERKSLSAPQIKFTFRPDGRSVSEAETVGPGELVVVPPDPKMGERVVTAGQFLMAFDQRSRLELLRGLSPTRIVYRPPLNAPPGSTAQESSADRLEAAFETATQTLRQVEQAGNFQFRDGDRQASAQEARYLTATQVLTLTGRPQVWDSNSRMKCTLLLLDLRNDTAEATGKVQATHLRNEVQTDASRHPEPTNVLADRMMAQRRSQFVHYEGHVRAWHGPDVVESSALDVSRTERRVSSGSEVLTSHLQPASLVAGTGPAAGLPPRETRPVTIRADRLDYFDQGRKATYRGNVHLQTENTTLEAERMDVYFSNAGAAGPSEVERALAEGHVKVVQPGRHASGEHAEYFAGPGKIVMTGGPPELFDAAKGFTTGQRLTFFIHDDRLFVDGGDESPALSKHRVAQ
jgi:lipopolysaccharide export system protein LptA